MGCDTHPAASTVRRLVERFFPRSGFVSNRRVTPPFASVNAWPEATLTRRGALLSCLTEYGECRLKSDRSDLCGLSSSNWRKSFIAIVKWQIFHTNMALFVFQYQKCDQNILLTLG